MITEHSKLGASYNDDLGTDGMVTNYSCGTTNLEKTPFLAKSNIRTPSSQSTSGRSSIQKKSLFQSNEKQTSSSLTNTPNYHYIESDESPDTEAAGQISLRVDGFKKWLKMYMLKNNVTYSSVVASLVLLFVTLFMTVVRSVDFVVYIRLATQMKNYDFIFGGILLTIGFNVICWPVVLFLTFVTGDIKKESWRLSTIFKCMIMGLMDFLNVILSTIPAVFVSGTINLVMGQSVIPINFLFSYIFLHHRYRFTHWVGLVLLFVGIGVAIVPQVIENSNSETTVPPVVVGVCTIVLFISYIPMSISNVVKEKYLKDLDLNVWFVNAWVALFQLVCGFIMLPTIFIPLPPPGVYEEFNNFGNYIMGSLKCIAGINSKSIFYTVDRVKESINFTGASLTRQQDRCEGVFYIFFLFLLLNMTYNILMLVVFKKGTSTLAVVGSTARLAMSSFLFLWGWIAGPAEQLKLTLWDGISLVFLIVGVIVYGILPQKMAPKSDPFRKFMSTMVGLMYGALCCFKKKPENAIVNSEEKPAHYHAIYSSEEEYQEKKNF